MRRHSIVDLILIIILTLSLACSTQESIIEVPIEETAVFDTLDFIALGDSYTIGQGVSISESWPYQLIQKLEYHGFNVGETKVIAQTGWTTRSLLNAIEDTDFSQYRDQRIVSLLIGVNNQYQSIPFETFQTEFDLLLQEAIRIAGNEGKVFVMSVPDYGVTSFGMNFSDQISQEIDSYNYFILDKCDDYNIPFIDITHVSRELGNTEQALSPDLLHPSRYQYERWVGVMLPSILAIVAK